MRLSYVITVPLLCFSILALKLADSGSPSSCPHAQRDALLRFKVSLSVVPPSSSNPSINVSNDRTASWRGGVDCCSWDGIACDRLTGDVIGLDLSFSWLQGVISSNSSLFSLRSLRSLNLAGNDFSGSSIPSEMSVFEGMTHLNLSSSGFGGYVPAEISRLSKLVSLDLSGNSLAMLGSTMRRLVGNLTELEELDLSYSDMMKVSHSSLMNFSASLTYLSFLECWLWGQFPDYIFQLPNLRKLDLSSNSLYGTLPESNWSSHLAFLSLAGCSFTGEIPPSIGNLRELTYLDLWHNNITGHFDFENLSYLKNLWFLGLSSLPGLSVSGKYVADENHKLPKLEILEISSGTLMNFPCFLSSMPELKKLTLRDGILEEPTGQCDDEGMIVLPHLEELDMSNCSLKKFPSFLSQSNKLRALHLSKNMIKETPSWFWGISIDTLELLDVGYNLIQGGIQLPWKRLTDLYLQNNSFEGPLPTPAQSVKYFFARQNHFHGSIHPSICQLTFLDTLDLAWNNLTGIIPQCLGNLTALVTLYLSNNLLTGPLPQSLVNCKSITVLDVSYNHLNGTPAEWLPIGSLVMLALQNNFFEGRWPKDIFLRWSNLPTINLSSNRFEGTPPPPSFRTMEYSISSNNFSGEIPSLICNGRSLQLLDMSNNSLTGTLPTCLKNFTGLLILNLRMNKFHGVIPEIFPDESILGLLDFSRNQFEGSLPRSLLNCKKLVFLNVGNNRIADSFPYWLKALPLKVLSLRSNKFYGGLNNSKGNIHFSELRILDLSDNEFDGRLPDNLVMELSAMTRADNVSGVEASSADSYMISGLEFDSLEINWKGKETQMVKINVVFATLDMSSNRFHGELSENVGLLKSLKGLNLSHNRLTGSIPPSLGSITYLNSLDLSSNQLVGGIPKELTELASLGVLNLSQNNLTGPIPTGGHLDTFPSSSFEGNLGLCGIQLSRKCGKGISGSSPSPLLPDRDDDGEDGRWGWSDGVFVASGFGSGMVIGISLGYMALETGRPLWLARMALRLEAKCRMNSRRNGGTRRRR